MSKADEMYSEEELKAIETIKKDNEYFEKHNIKTNASILLNLIEKQQKEIKNSVSKDKIRELKEFYIEQGKKSNLFLIPLENLTKNINKLLEE